MEFEIDPSAVYFTHSKIRKQFSGNGKLLSETLEEVLNGTTKVEAIPKIRVIFDGSRYYSMNNRRLWVYKELQKRGKLATVKVELRRAESKSEARLGQQTLALEAKAILK